MPQPAPNEMMVNAQETLPMSTGRRPLARGVGTPNVEFRQLEGADMQQCRCPSCGTFRPAMCVALTVTGWLCDGCISDQRRRGVFVEWPGHGNPFALPQQGISRG